MVKKLVLLCIVMSLLLINAACVIQQGNQREKTYDEDGMLGITNVNPNLHTSPTHYNYSEDLALANQVLRQFPLVLDSRVMINGGRAYVKIHIKDGLTRTEVEYIESQVRDALSYQLPRYDIHLTSDKSNLRQNQKVQD